MYMEWLHIMLLVLFVAVGCGVLWLTAPPRLYQLVPPADRRQIDSLVPDGAFRGNSVETFTSLDAMLPRMLDDVARARHHVHMQFFKFEDDATSHLVGDALAAAAARGVEPRLLYDDFMCRRWRGYYRKLQRRGVATAGFRPVRWPLLHRVDYYRNHRKCIVVDGRVAYIGGVNIADRYRYGLQWGHWRDTVVRIEGPAALAVQRAFAFDWHYATGALLATEVYFPAPVRVGALPVHIVMSGPIGDGPRLLELTVAMVDAARRYVWFESPYFIPPAALRRALLAAARRGVDVRVLLPPRGDRGETTQWASKSYFATMLAAGVSIGLYQPGYMHSKIIVSDDRTAVVGSCNIDPRSYLLCQEIAAVVDDEGYAASLKAVFQADEADSHFITPAEWAARPLSERLCERAARLVASQL